MGPGFDAVGELDFGPDVQRAAPHYPGGAPPRNTNPPVTNPAGQLYAVRTTTGGTTW